MPNDSHEADVSITCKGNSTGWPMQYPIPTKAAKDISMDFIRGNIYLDLRLLYALSSGSHPSTKPTFLSIAAALSFLALFKAPSMVNVSFSTNSLAALRSWINPEMIAGTSSIIRFLWTLLPFAPLYIHPRQPSDSSNPTMSAPLVILRVWSG